jgi:hypothetical protein
MVEFYKERGRAERERWRNGIEESRRDREERGWVERVQENISP